MRRFVLLARATALALLVVFVTASAAGACGSLVAANGAVNLVRTSTLAAYHDGVEHYVTSFEFTGAPKTFGSIIPLPDKPSKVEKAGNWTLQRLQREVAPPQRPRALAAAADVAGTAEVLLQAKIDALDLTVLRGGGDAVGRWALAHGFFLTPDAPAVLDHYAHRSKVFLAARFDASRARALGQTNGDGTPIMVTIPVAEPWVPLRILALGLDRSEAVAADVFLLTDAPPVLHADARDLRVERSAPARSALLDDLRADQGMGWVPESMWFTHLQVSSRAGALRGDLAVTTAPRWWPALTGAVVG